jgi:hypothetical protein
VKIVTWDLQPNGNLQLTLGGLQPIEGSQLTAMLDRPSYEAAEAAAADCEDAALYVRLDEQEAAVRQKVDELDAEADRLHERRQESLDGGGKDLAAASRKLADAESELARHRRDADDLASSKADAKARALKRISEAADRAYHENARRLEVQQVEAHAELTAALEGIGGAIQNFRLATAAALRGRASTTPAYPGSKLDPAEVGWRRWLKRQAGEPVGV